MKFLIISLLKPVYIKERECTMRGLRTYQGCIRSVRVVVWFPLPSLDDAEFLQQLQQTGIAARNIVERGQFKRKIKWQNDKSWTTDRMGRTGRT